MVFRDIFCGLAIFSAVLWGNVATSERAKRTLVYGSGSFIEWIIGIGTPVQNLEMPAASLGFFMRAIYQMPFSSANYTDPPFPELSGRRGRRSVTRWNVYEAMAKDSEMRGHGGRGCVLRAVCEAAEVPADTFHGLFEEVFHAIFTPDAHEEVNHYTDHEYLYAHAQGRSRRARCERLFPDCKYTFLDLYTRIFRHP